MGRKSPPCLLFWLHGKRTPVLLNITAHYFHVFNISGQYKERSQPSFEQEKEVELRLVKLLLIFSIFSLVQTGVRMLSFFETPCGVAVWPAQFNFHIYNVYSDIIDVLFITLFWYARLIDSHAAPTGVCFWCRSRAARIDRYATPTPIRIELYCKHICMKWL